MQNKEHLLHFSDLNSEIFSLLNSLQEALFLCDEQQKISDVNDIFAQLLGYTKEQIIGKTLVELTDDENIASVTAFCQNPPSNGAEIILQTKDLQQVYFFVKVKNITINNYDVKLFTLSDITKIKIENQHLLRQSKLAQMGEMINMIAHQWRQPLNAISASAIKLSMQNQLDLLTSKEVEKTSSFIQDSAQKMSQTINDFMNFTKPKQEKESIFLDDLLNEIFSLIENQLKDHNIEVEVSSEVDFPLYIPKQELQHVLINLITNARDALNEAQQEEKKIIIKTNFNNNICTITVEDNAGGIPDEHKEQIFEPYFTTKEQGKGTGIGLYMSRKILKELLNGEIAVSNKNGGASFEVILHNPKVDKDAVK